MNCATCGHIESSHIGACYGLDAAGDTCDCQKFVRPRQRTSKTAMALMRAIQMALTNINVAGIRVSAERDIQPTDAIVIEIKKERS